MKNFITFEGPDAAGKTTVISLVKEKLQTILSEEIVITREPGGSNVLIAEQIRSILHDKQNHDMHPKTEALLYAASRSQHTYQLLIPNLKAGKVVLCDRYVDSSIVYQGFGRELPIEDVETINKFATGGLTPSLTFVIVVDPDVSKSRLSVRKIDHNRMDEQGDAFLQKVYKGYYKLNDMYKERITMLEGTLQPQELANIIAKKIIEHLSENNEKLH